MAELFSFENQTVDEIRGTQEFLTQDTQGPENFDVDTFIARIAKTEGVGLTSAEDAWVKSMVGSNPVDGGPELPEHAHPRLMFLLTMQDDSFTPGLYIRSSASQNDKTSSWTANVAFGDAGAGALVWNNAHGTETGLPDELRSISIDAGGTLVIEADTDTALPLGPGDLSLEFHGINSDYEFTTTAYQQSFVAAIDQEIQFRGTIDPTGLAAGAPLRIVLTSGSNDNDYWTPPTVQWARVQFAGATGAAGRDGENGYSPVFAVVSANATAEDPSGSRRVLKVVDWIESTGDLDAGYSLFRGGYSATTTYAQGDIVVMGQSFYISRTSGNRGNALSDTAHWADITAEGGSGGGTGGGLNTSAVDARIRLLVASFAEAGDTSRIAKSKLPTDIVFDADVAGRLLPSVTSGDSGKVAKVDASGAWALADDEQGSGGGGLDQAAVDARIQAGVQDFAETGDTSRIPKTKLPSDTSYRTDAQVDARADARVRAGVADFAEQGNTDRLPKTKLPSDTSYRTDAQVDARADARIAGFARANSPSGTIPDARIPAAITRDSEVAGRLLPAVTASNNDKIAKVVSGAWALADDEEGSGGVSGGVGRGAELIYAQVARRSQRAQCVCACSRCAGRRRPAVLHRHQ